MDTTSKEAVWQGFRSQFEAILALEQQLRELDEQKERIRKQIAAKKRSMVNIGGCGWPQIVNQFGKILATHTRAVQDNGAAASSSLPTKGTREKTVRQWVLQAIAHYEDENPQSHIDEASIRIYINAEAPAFLDGFNQNVIYTSLHGLRTDRCVIVAQKRSGRGKSQYALTEKGRAELALHSSAEDKETAS